MRQLIILILLGFGSETYSQSDLDTIGYPLRYIYKFCSSRPIDTAYRLNYFYNDLHQRIKKEKYIKNSLSEYFDYYYDSKGKFLNQEHTVVLNLNEMCSKRDFKQCEKEAIQIYGLKNAKSYTYDTINKLLHLHNGKVETKIIKTDSIFINSKLKTIIRGTDTLFIFEYDTKNRLIKKFDYSYGSKIWIKYTYKKDLVFEYYYSNKNKKPYQITKLTFDNNNRLIEKLDTYIFKGRKQPSNNFGLAKYTYFKNRLVLFEYNNNSIDPCLAECCDQYIEKYEYLK